MGSVPSKRRGPPRQYTLGDLERARDRARRGEPLTSDDEAALAAWQQPKVRRALERFARWHNAWVTDPRRARALKIVRALMEAQRLLADDHPAAGWIEAAGEEALDLARSIPPRHRRSGTAMFKSRESLRSAVRPAVVTLRRQGREPTKENVAGFFSRSSDPRHPATNSRQLLRWCNQHGYGSWDALIADIDRA